LPRIERKLALRLAPVTTEHEFMEVRIVVDVHPPAALWRVSGLREPQQHG
jgi:hypothetical protein